MTEENPIKKKRRWLRVLLWVLLTPVALFTLAMILLYVPPVQNFLRRQATAIASEATGMDISVERIDLRFPLNLLVRGALVVQPPDSAAQGMLRPDTLLNLGSLNVRIQAWPLLHGRVEVDRVTLNDVSVNSAGLLDGMRVEGRLGRFFLKSHGVDLLNEEVILNDVELEDSRVKVLLSDMTVSADEDTVATSVKWRLTLQNMKLKNFSADLAIPLDTTTLSAYIGEMGLTDAEADLGVQRYGWQRFQLAGASVRYDVGSGEPAEGFDASHIALRDIQIGIDSVLYYGRNVNGVIRKFSCNERSGLSLASLTGRVFADSTLIQIPRLHLLTGHSEVELSAQTYWELIDIPTTGHFSARLEARLGKQDVLLFAGGLPEDFKQTYPSYPLVVRAGTEGNLKQMQISRFQVDLPGAFSMQGGGELWNVTDSLTRSVQMDFDMQTLNLGFLTTLAGEAGKGTLAIPDSMHLVAKAGLEGNRLSADMSLLEGRGKLALNASYDLATEVYGADLSIDSLQLHHFLPQDSLYELTLHAAAKGRGIDFTSKRTVADASLQLDALQYGKWYLSGVNLKAGVKSALASVNVSSDNALLEMQAVANMRLDRKYLDGSANLNVDRVGLYELGLVPERLVRPLAFRLEGEVRSDTARMELSAGDLNLWLRAQGTVDKLMQQGNQFAELLMKQVEDRKLDHVALRRALPTAGMFIKAGKDNPVNDLLAQYHMGFNELKLSFGFTPERGINGRSSIHGLHTDSLLLDTIFFAVHQDTTRIKLQSGVINNDRNPQIVFRSTLTGEIRSEDAELTLDFEDERGEKGILFGINARPLSEGNGKGNGILLNLTPAQPIIAYRKFSFADQANWIYLHKNMRVYANVDMDSDDGICFRMQSDRQDTVSLQNINVELSRFRLSELSKVMPYLPKLTGLFSAEATYIQTENSLQVSAEANVQKLTYEKQPVGDVGLGVTWLPGEANTHYLSTYLLYNNQDVLSADGTLVQQGEKSLMDISTSITHLPLTIANAFVPDQMATLSGRADGELQISGSMDQPALDGSLSLDSANVYVKMLGARYWMDNRPIRLDNNRLLFDKFAIYTTSNNPFAINGYVDFRNVERPTANLTLQARNYTLLNAKRTRESMVYGKVLVDLMGTVSGPLDGLKMRGNMNLLGSTDVTYVLTDSPLAVEDRLDGLVSFVSFRDTTSVAPAVSPNVPLGGLDMLMSVHIDDAVRLRADLSPDRSQYIELEGGGDLSWQYTPQGDMSLTGRYTFSGGVMKFSLPVIPLKEFQIVNGSYVDWRGDVMAPTLNLKAQERMRASVADGDDGSGSRMVNFDVSIALKGRLESPELVFDLAAPEDATVENQLQSMGAEERSKQAITMMATGIYLNDSGKGGGLTMGSALNSVLQSQINALAGGVKGASFSVGIEDRTSAETGDKQTDYSFRYSQRLFNDRVQIIIGGKVSTGANATNDVESFIDNISLEYRLDASGTRYIRAFHNKNYESVLDGEITETGVGLVLRRKMDRLGELFIFRRKKRPVPQSNAPSDAASRPASESDKSL